MSEQVSINFRVAGSELSNYIDSIQKKSDALTSSAIKGALAQTNASKEALKVINDQIAAIERKNRIESQAARSVALQQREDALKKNRESIIGRAEGVYNDLKAGKFSESTAKEKILSIEGSGKEAEEKIKTDYRDNLTILREQERQSKLQTALSRENIDALKSTARENVKAIQTGDKRLGEIISNASSDEELLVSRLTEEGVSTAKKKEDKQVKSGNQVGLFGELLAIDNIKQAINTFGQFSQTKNGFDLIQPASNLAGRIVGGILGGVVGTFLEPGLGTLAGAGMGGDIGGGIGNTIGALEQREALSKEAFKKSVFRYQAITGNSLDANSIPDMSESGVDFTDYMNMRSEWARRRGYAYDSDKTTQDAIYLDKGFGVDQGTSAAVVEIQRSAKEGNRDLANIVASILERGQSTIFKNDTTFLNEFLGKYTSLTKELLKGQDSVASALPMDILTQFNSVGGMLSARDPRSGGIINSINDSLANPDTDNLKAMEFGILRRQYPNKGIFDLREEMQKGLGSPGLLKGVLNFVDNLGGDDQSKMMNLSREFNGIPLSAVRSIWQGYKSGRFQKFDNQELRSLGINESIIRGTAENNTTTLDKNTASIENRILGGEAVDEMSKAFIAAVQETLGGAVIELKNGQGTIYLGSIRGNTTKSPSGNSTNSDSTNKNFKDLSPDQQADLYRAGGF